MSACRHEWGGPLRGPPSSHACVYCGTTRAAELRKMREEAGGVDAHLPICPATLVENPAFEWAVVSGIKPVCRCGLDEELRL